MNRSLHKFVAVVLLGGCLVPVTFAARTETAFPLATLDKLVRMKLAAKPAAREWQFLSRLERGREADQETVLRAMLFASGVTAQDAQAKYARQLGAIVAAARRALASAKTPPEKGRRLLEFLHAEYLANGYKFKATSLTHVFERAEFNCVSASALYNLVGRALGLTIKGGIELSGPMGSHAFSVLIDGERYYRVETTNAEGFDAPVEPRITPGDPRLVGDLGLACSIYYNRAIDFMEAGDQAEALRAYYCALVLWPTDPGARQNLYALFHNGTLSLLRNKEYDKVLSLTAGGLMIFPKTGDLHAMRREAWRLQALDLLTEGKDTAALTLLRRAARLDKDAELVKDQALVYGILAHKLCTQGRHTDAVALMKKGWPLIDAPARERFLEFFAACYDDWAMTAAQEEGIARALAIYAEGLKELPDSPLLLHNLVYWQQQLERGSELGGDTGRVRETTNVAAAAQRGGNAERSSGEQATLERVR